MVLTVTDVDGRSTSATVRVTARGAVTQARLTIAFATNRAALSPRARRQLTALRDAYANGEVVRITGYCAASEVRRGSALMRLSRDRALSVLALLRAHHNATKARVIITGVAASHFIATNTTAAGRARNRRATVIVRYLKPLA